MADPRSHEGPVFYQYVSDRLSTVTAGLFYLYLTFVRIADKLIHVRLIAL